VVLLHGMPEFWWGWRHQLPGLVHAGFRVIVPDQRGYNDSEKPSGAASYQMAHLAEDVRSLVAALGYPSVYLAGHDWGGIVAFQLAIRHPDAVRKLVVFNAFHPLALEEAQAVPAPSAEPTIGWYRLMFHPHRVGRARRLHGVAPRGPVAPVLPRRRGDPSRGIGALDPARGARGHDAGAGRLLRLPLTR
jgi:pimeloyl-ACP methyl ester carboxylesterase